MYIKVERIDKPLFNWLIAGCTRSLKKANHLTWYFLLMLPMEAKPTRECERPLRPKRSLLSFTWYSSLLAFVCFGISSVVPLLKCDDFFESLLMLQGILAGEHNVFRIIPSGSIDIIFFNSDRDTTINDKYHKIMVSPDSYWKKKDFPLKMYRNRFDLHIVGTECSHLTLSRA